MAKEALESMANQINDHYIPLDINHQGTYIGVVLAGKVKEMEDGEYGLYGVMGIFDAANEISKFPYGSKNVVYQDYLGMLQKDIGSVEITINFDRIFQRELQQKLNELDPNLKPEIYVRKTFDAVQITGLVIESADLLINILNLLVSLKKQKPESFFKLTLQSGDRRLEIDTNQEINATEIIDRILEKVMKQD